MSDLLQLHPFVEGNKGVYHILPPQMVSLRDKLPNKDGEPSKWAKETLDVLGRIARIQYNSKRRYLTNYKLINGEFVPTEYYENENKEEFDLLNEVQKDLEIPSFIRNYDIISQPYNTLVGELSELPDLFDVEGKGDMIESDKLKLKKNLLKKWFDSQIKNKVLEELLKQGIDPENPESIQNEEQAQQLEQLKQEIESEMSPPEIEEKISKDYRHMLENWGTTELKDQIIRFNIKKCQRIEFGDYLAIGERYRHIYTDGFGLRVESKNPLNVFSHKSPETEYIQDGDYAGFVEYMSVSSIIDRYGHLMSKKQLDKLQRQWRNTYKTNDKLGHTMDGKPINYMNPQGLPYQTALPTLNRDFNEYAPWMNHLGSTPLIILDDVETSKITGNGDFASYGILTVINAYWKSQKKIGKLFWINPETGVEEKLLVDETFYIPKSIKEVQGSVMFLEKDEINTITWTWINETWRGIKIDNYNTNTLITEPIYIDIRPNDLQFKGELYIYGCKLPIGGQYANNRNTKPTSLVDKLKPYQFFYNVLMNQCFHYLQTEILPFAVMDAKIIPKDKDWAGEDRVEKWLNLAQTLGVTIADTSLENTKGEGSQGGQYPREINLDRSNRIATRLQMAAAIRQLALEQVGISQQRLGDVKSTETATGVNQSISRSYTQTNSWFESFFDCEREILQMQVDAAQYLQSKKLDIGNIEINSMFTDGLLEINNNDFNLYQLHVYVHKSQEERRKLQYAQKLAEMNTTNTPMSERILMGTSDDIKDIVHKLKIAEQESMQQQQQMQEMEQQKMQEMSANADKERAFKAEQNQLDRDYDLYRAYIQAFGYSNSTEQDADKNNVLDMLEFTKLTKQVEIANAKLQNDTNKVQINSENQRQMKMMEIADKDKQRQHEQILADKDLKQAKIQGDKSK